MKANSYILLVLITAPVALALGASLSMAFTAFIAVSILSMTGNDYKETRYDRIGAAI